MHVILLDPGNGDVAASDLQARIDLAQLIAQTALIVGQDRAAEVALAKMGKAELPSLVPLLQPVALDRATRSELRGRKSLLTGLRKKLLATAPDGEVPPVQLERIRPRAVITLVAGVFAAYLLASQLANVSFSNLLDARQSRLGVRRAGAVGHELRRGNAHADRLRAREAEYWCAPSSSRSPARSSSWSPRPLSAASR